MSLLQIAEPGTIQKTSSHKIAIGIDLGTTNSLVASLIDKTPQCLVDENQEVLMPSVVRYLNNKLPVVGTQAKNQSEIDPENTIISVKRMLGRSLTDIRSTYPHLPYHLQETQNGTPSINTCAGLVNPIQVSAEILQSLASRARHFLCQAPKANLDGVVITVPAYFDDAQRAGTKDAAKLAGLPLLRLLNEPTAAAIAYGLDSGQEGVIAVYDFGGGTFDISILHLSKGVFEVLATGGDSALGGDDLDQAIAHWIKQESGACDIVLTGSSERQLINIAKAVKEQLSDDEQVEVKFLDWQAILTRDTFNRLIQPLVKRTFIACRRALKDAQVSLDEIQNIVMVGGSTRVPLVRDKVEDFFKKTPLTSIDPDQVVAIGAAIQADILVGNQPGDDMLLLDVLPLTLGIEVMGELVEPIIARNTPIPVAKAQDFTTFKDGQTAMLIHVLQGERDRVKDCRSLAKVTLRGIPPMLAGTAQIRVTYRVDADGLLEVTAMEKETGITVTTQVKPTYGLTEEEVNKMIADSFAHVEEDWHARVLTEQRVEADRVIEALVSALMTDGDKLLTSAEYKSLEKAIESLIMLRNGEDHHAIEEGIKALDEASKEFAARRMDLSIKQALAGKSVDNL